jgi:hypothetical protein
MKIIKRTPLLKNLLLFLVLSIFYLHVTSSLHEQRSAMEWEELKSLLIENRMLAAFLLGAFWTTFFAKKSSKLFIMMYLSFIFGQTFYFFLMSFDKLILLLNFSYLVFSFFFFLLWKQELERACYNPGYQVNELGLTPEYDLPLLVTSSSHRIHGSGHLMNWDESSCFLILESSIVDLKGQVEVELFFQGKTFKAAGYVVAKYGNGIGLSFQRDKQIAADFTTLNWDTFYDIISDRGYIIRSVQRVMV